MDIGSIGAAINSLKAAKDIAQAMLELKVSADVQAKVIELQNRILEAQSRALDGQTEHFELSKKLAEVEAELARLKAWHDEQSRYALREVSPSVFVREILESMRNGEPQHWLCCNCFDKGEKSILQFAFDSGPAKSYKCHRCGSEIRVENSGWRPPNRGNRGGSWMAS